VPGYLHPVLMGALVSFRNACDDFGYGV
jgi:hypothetical protein